MYLLTFLLLFYFLVFFVRSFLLWKNTGIKPMTFDGSDDAHGYNGRLFKFIAVLELLVIIANTLGETAQSFLLPFWYLENDMLKLSGWLSLLASLVWVFIAQLQMGNSWRIGIDYQRPTTLVNSGLFSISRNPIFLGILMADLGLFLVIPNAFTLLVGALSYFSIQIQVRLEEQYLFAEKGSEYQDYQKQVRRWL